MNPIPRPIQSSEDLREALAAASKGVTTFGVVAHLRDKGLDHSASLNGGNPDGLYAVGSPTKVFTTAMVLQLVDSGKIHLDSPVASYLPEFGVDPPEMTNAITVRHLMTHSSGLDCADDFTDTGEGDDALGRFVREVVAGCSLLHDPGSHWSYCNAGFSLLGRLIEVADGQAWDDSFIQRVADPLGLSARPATRAPTRERVGGHSVDPRTNEAVGENRLMGRNGGPAGSNMLATAYDLAHFADAVSRLDGSYLSSDMVATMAEPQISGPNRVQALGWVVPRPGLLSHAGITLGHTSHVITNPTQRRTLSVVINGPGASEIVEGLTSELFGIPEPAKIQESPTQPIDPAKLEGLYLRRHVAQELQYSNGKLQATTRYSGPIAEFFPDSVDVELEPLRNDVFVGDVGPGGVTTEFVFQGISASGAPDLLMVANRLHLRTD